MSYDGQGRLAKRGGLTYTFDATGILTGRGSDAFAFGPLRRLGGAGGAATAIDYAFDSLGRRTARFVGGQTEQFLYGEPNKPWQLTAWPCTTFRSNFRLEPRRCCGGQRGVGRPRC